MDTMLPLYRDTMDETRFVRPREVRGNRYLCAVYFDEGLGLQFVGTAEVPRSLFSEGSRVGFVPASTG
jgi:hypothetical protein